VDAAAVPGEPLGDRMEIGGEHVVRHPGQQVLPQRQVRAAQLHEAGKKEDGYVKVVLKP
jgi:hypothetical protein